MLGQVTRRSHQLPAKIQRQPQAPIGEVEIKLFGVFFADVLVPAPDTGREHLRHVFRQAQGLADIRSAPSDR